MTFKEFVILHLQIYFVLVTLIFAASIIVGIILIPEESLNYSQLTGPFITAGLCVLPTCVTYFKKEPSIKQYIIRHVIQLAMIECIVLLLISPKDGVNKAVFYTLIAAIVLVIYLLTKLVMWLPKYLQSKKLTEQLKELQASEQTSCA